MKIRIVQIPVTLYFELPEGYDADAYGYDAANELLREHQRSFSPLSGLLDYTVEEPTGMRLDTGPDFPEYEEGDVANAEEE